MKKIVLILMVFILALAPNLCFASSGDMMPRGYTCDSCNTVMNPDNHVGTWYFNGTTQYPCPNHGAEHERREYERIVDQYYSCPNCGYHMYVTSYYQYTYGHPNL